jgi:ribosomal protein L28
MSKQCEICKKKSKIVGKRVKLRGKYNPTTKKRKKPNLQWVKLPSGKRFLVCSECRKLLIRDKKLK